ncbi:MAG: DUF927 domain-containing protein [Clostridia bacterium]|nr:DUF927 domain-containing protein [Clostridia bacterium]
MAEKVTGEIMADAELHFDPMPDFTEEDFRNTKKPLLWVLSHASEGEYMVARYSDMVVEAARQYGIFNYRSQYTAFMKVWRKECRTRVENVTAFERQPMELFCGAFEATEEGVYCYSAYDDRVCACPHPILPIRRLVDIDSGEVRLEVAFRRGARWQTVTVDKSTLASAAKIVALSTYGVGVDSENARYLVKYFTEVEHLNYDMIPETASVSRLGWIGDGSFSPYVEGVEFDGDVNYQKAYAAVYAHGDEGAWCEAVGSARRESKIVRLYIAAAFASALVKPCSALPFIVHLWGGSGAGKTVALKVAASVWADPSDDGGYIRTFNATPVGLEMAASFVNSLPLCLDELQIAKDRKNFDDLIYMLTEGVGRVRGAKTGGIQAIRTWRCAVLSTGEMPVAGSSSGAGAVNRIIEIDCKEEKLFSDPRGIISDVSRSYGHAGRKFAELLCEERNLSLAKALQAEYFTELSRNDTTEKQALSASLILTADHLADLWIFHEDESLCVADIAPFLSTKDEVDSNRRALDWLYGWVAENSNAFMRRGDVYVDGGPRGAVYGRITEKGIAIIKTVFERAMADAGYNPAAFLSWAKRGGVLADCGRDHLSVPVRISGSLTRCVVIRPLDNKEAELEIDDIEEGLPI